MSELVLLHHNEPMTTSETLAEGVQLQHKNVVALIRKHVADLAEWGEIAFQTRFNPQGRPTEFVWLNEGQALFLLTLMRNAPVVVAFKKALVRAFLELRDQARIGAANAAPQFLTANLSHGADLAVAADRTFRSFLRAARSAGVALPQALRIANRQTVERTGMDMLAELGLGESHPETPGAAPVFQPDPLEEAIAAWQTALDPEQQDTFTMEQIIAEATGIGRHDKRFASIAPRIGRILRSAGWRREKRRRGRVVLAFWDAPWRNELAERNHRKGEVHERA